MRRGITAPEAVALALFIGILVILTLWSIMPRSGNYKIASSGSQPSTAEETVEIEKQLVKAEPGDIVVFRDGEMAVVCNNIGGEKLLLSGPGARDRRMRIRNSGLVISLIAQEVKSVITSSNPDYERQSVKLAYQMGRVPATATAQ